LARKTVGKSTSQIESNKGRANSRRRAEETGRVLKERSHDGTTDVKTGSRSLRCRFIEKRSHLIK